MKNHDFGNKLIQARQAKGWTQMDLAEKSNISLRTIQRIESGQVNPRAYTLKQLSEIIGLDFNEMLENSGDSKSKNPHSNFNLSKVILWHISDLFNLKTNTMKKVTILSSIMIVAAISLFSIIDDSEAQTTEDSQRKYFVETNSRGIIYLIPHGQKTVISNMKDTADLRVDSDLIQEYKGNIFLNKNYIGRALEGDTVKYNQGILEIVDSYYLQTSSYRNDIFYLFPKGQMIDNMSLFEGTESFHFSGHVLKEKNNKIFFDDRLIGNVQAGDTILYNNGKVKLL
jgi:transcriptional regulator with XRE-family HTH domain